MRIISGVLKGRKLFAPRGMSLRPTSDRVKESLFNMLGDEVKGKIVLDLFAGTGNIGLEALSRGAGRVTFVEKSREAAALIRKNLMACKMEERSVLLQRDVNQAIGYLKEKKERFDLIFIDPPYEKGLIQKTIDRLAMEKIYHDHSILIIEHHKRESLSSPLGAWDLTRQRRIGETVLSFLTPKWR